MLITKAGIMRDNGEDFYLRKHGVGPGVKLMHSFEHVMHAGLRREALVQIVDELSRGH